MGIPTSRRTFRQATATLVCLGLVVGPLPARAEDTITCESRGFGYRYCRIDTDNRVELVRTFSIVSCRQDRSWGYDRHGVWVDRGCAAEFRVGRRHGNDRAAVGVALVGLAALAAIAACQEQAGRGGSGLVGGGKLQRLRRIRTRRRAADHPARRISQRPRSRQRFQRQPEGHRGSKPAATSSASNDRAMASSPPTNANRRTGWCSSAAGSGY